MIKRLRLPSLILPAALSVALLTLALAALAAAGLPRKAAMPAASPTPRPWTPAIPIVGRLPRPTPSLPDLDSLQQEWLTDASPAADREPRSPDADRGVSGWYENDTQGVRQTWSALQITGTGVRIGVLDSGVDFGNPALAGRYAVQPATPTGTQAYAGWPIAFDAYSMESFIADPDRAWPENWVNYVNASYAITGTGIFSFSDPMDPGTVYTAPGSSKSGRYLLGYHPDSYLGGAVLVADRAISGTYDTVHLDLDADGQFESLVNREEPVSTLDTTGDGVPDRSGGLLTWIADGLNTPPGMDAVYGTGGPVPAAGTLLAFMIDSGWHGTACASAAVGNDGGLFIPSSTVVDFYTETYGSLVQGPAPGATIIPLGNFYGGGAWDAWFAFTVLGYDGAPGSGDEPHLVSLSFDEGTIDNDVWDEASRSIAALNITYGDASPLYIPSAGNGGPGYGTATSPKPATALVVGASTQYGTVNAWGMGISETVSSPERVNWGDVARLSGRAPGADGSGAIDLVANGIVGSGAWPLNRSADGTRSFIHWYGTSRSAPDAAGMAALAYQAFFQAHGRYPTWQEGTRLMLNGAADRNFDPFAQGAGAANAFFSAQSALGVYGVQVDPPRVEAGDFRGRRYPAFPGGLARGESEIVTLTLSNPASVPVTVSLAAQHLVTVGRYLTTVATLIDRASNHNAAPDYALDLTPWVTAHPDADLMVVRMAVPYEHFDTLPPTPADNSRNRWALLLYNWWDDDGDGAWWDDGNGDGRVDFPAELDSDDEWMRFDFNNHNSAVLELSVGQPYSRSLGAGSGGIWAGAAHTTRSAGDNRTTLLYEVSFFRRERWEAVSLSDELLVLPARGEAAVQAEILVPPDAAYGLHQGVLLVGDPGRTDVDPLYVARQLQVPLVWGVWPDAAAGATVEGTPRAETRYDNGSMLAGFNWNYLESGDWRFFNFDLRNPPAGSALLAHTIWEDYPADLDTHLYGPVMDDYSAADPDWFGPSGLDRVGGSVRAGERPSWEFQTATGNTEEWAAAPARDGLHTLVQQAVLLGGHQAATPFSSSLGLLQVSPYPLRFDPARCDPTCTLTATLSASLDILIGITGSHTFGWFAPAVHRDQAISAGKVVTHGLTFTEPLYRLSLSLSRVTNTGRLDLALYDDGGGELARSIAAPVDQELLAYALPAGSYWLRVDSREVAPAWGAYDLRVLATPESSDNAFAVGNLPAELAAHEAASFTVTVPGNPAYGTRGHLVLGLPGLPRVLELPLLVQRAYYLPIVWR